MSDCMHFPDTVEEFMEQYKVTDTKQVYSNGTEYVPIFRMKQWFEHEAVKGSPPVQPEQEKYEYHYDHTDCIWFRPEARNRCPSTCAQYRDGWNDAMNYIFRDGKGYRPYRRDKQYGE